MPHKKKGRKGAALCFRRRLSLSTGLRSFSVLSALPYLSEWEISQKQISVS
jgi:hypothetical protein